MKNINQLIIALGLSLLLMACNKTTFVSDQWELSYDAETNGIRIEKENQLICAGLYAAYRLDGKEITTKDYPVRKFKTSSIRDNLGKGKSFTIVYSGNDLPVLKQTFTVYPDQDYILTDFSLKAEGNTISSNYMAPVCMLTTEAFNTETSRALFIPFDNDCWVRYQSHPLTFDQLTSYEVSAIFDNTSRRGLVVGSVEHDTWKTAIEMKGNGNVGLSSLICYGGIADSLTRDSKPHGTLSGKTIRSPKILLGVFSDWRDGLDTYGNVNAAIAPRKAWDKDIPFGWNSWGALQFNLRYNHAMEISDFFKNHLQANGFANKDNTVYIGLDSGWNRFSEEELKAFVEKCKENGQIAGIYWTPFTDWSRNPEGNVDDAPSYKYKDVYVYANGKPQELDGAYAIDPTHPAIEERMQKVSDLFRRCGFEYVKTDFMTHGAMEGDRWYNADIQTGIQAYNYGLKLLNQYFDGMYINFSIAPLFPANYAQSRRIACDAWNKIKDTEYTMNALSYGWWLDKVYQYNDADHVVLRDATEGENRARITSAVITGLYIAGDDFSDNGDNEAKERAIKYLTNPQINALATGRSFRPIEGNGEKSECQFMRMDETGTYYVYFNYTEEDVQIQIPLERIDETVSQKTDALDLWNDQTINLQKPLTIPAKDVLVVKL